MLCTDKWNCMVSNNTVHCDDFIYQFVQNEPLVKFSSILLYAVKQTVPVKIWDFNSIDYPDLYFFVQQW